MGTSPIEPALPRLALKLLERLLGFPNPRRFWVAYSGGVDSHTLLHALAMLRPRLSAEVAAVHVDHGLEARSGEWTRHCEAVCAALSIPLETHRLSLEVGAGESVEAVAREGRYGVFRRLLDAGDILLTAHHLTDQAETVLLQLIRGSGPSGLAAMPAITRLGEAWLARPFLDLSRDEIVQYAEAQGLAWVDDPSNRSVDMDRNYLRREVMPRLAARWPSVAVTFARSARHCAEAQGLIDGLAAADLQGLIDGVDGSLAVAGVSALPPPRARAVLRAWIRGRGHRLPDTVRLDRIMTEMLTAKPDRNPLVAWGGTEIRRYRGRLYAIAPLPPPAPGWHAEWEGEVPLELPGGGSLRTARGGRGIPDARWRGARREVSFRSEGVRLRPAGRGVSVSFKKFCQERGIPPWERAGIPLLYLDGELAAVADLCLCEGFATAEGEPGIGIVWTRGPDPTAGRTVSAGTVVL